MDDMSNLEAQPVEQECEGHPAESEIQILTPRDVPLGGRGPCECDAPRNASVR